MVENKEISLGELLPEINKSRELKEKTGSRFTINIAGQSAAGKTTIYTLVSSGIEDSLIIDMDDYLKGGFIDNLSHDSGNLKMPFFAGLNPEVYDLDSLLEDVLSLRAGESIQRPVFDEIEKSRVGIRSVNPSKTIVLDGIYAFDTPFSELADLKILVEATLHDRLMRKLVRNHVFYKENVDEIISRYLTQDEPAYAFHRDRLYSAADLVVQNPANPPVEHSSLLQIRDVEKINKNNNAAPKKTYGAIHLCEDLIFNTNAQGNVVFEYSVVSKTLIRGSIKPSTFDLIQNFYIIANNNN